MATDILLAEFAPVSTETWEQAIHKDLKGADYTKKLIWQSDEGLAAKPYYRKEDIARLSLSPHCAAITPNSRLNGDWHIREEIDAVDPEHANRLAQSAVSAGARRDCLPQRQHPKQFRSCSAARQARENSHPFPKRRRASASTPA